MKKLLACFIIFLVFNDTVRAQNKLKIPFGDGDIFVQQYATNIYKLTFQSSYYNTNENISDAVILKPLALLNKALINNGDTSLSFDKTKKAELSYLVLNKAYRALQFSLTADEKIFGGGERALPLNRRGYKFNLYNNPSYGYSEGADNLNYSVPFFTSNKGYGLFFDNPSKGYADIGKTNSNIFEVGFTSGEINVYIILGKDYKEILQSYHKLTGTQPLPPRWAFGNLMSRFGYNSEAQVKDILGKMKEENIPVDAVIFDLFWFGDSIKGTMGNLDWVNKKAWPNPKKMIGDFKKDGINTILITEPFVLKSSLNYNQSKPFHAVDLSGKPYLLTDFYFGQSGLIDIFRKDAQQWFWSKHKPQMDNGVEAWWGDLGEPEKHPSNLYHNLKDLGFKRLFKADEVHNLYGHTWTKMLYNNYAKNYPNKRLFSLNRSGFAGSQRYGIFPWTGDVSRSWSGLRSQLKVLLGMSMSGVPYVHSDAGGFAGGEGDNELYIRWLQMAAFTPIFRPHGTALYEIDKNAFSFPSEAALIDTPYRKIAKEIINLRYSLLPYNYTLAYEQAKYGKPLIAPLYYHFPNDKIAAEVEDEFMWGENILVAPVVQKGATTRKVYLPKGNWYSQEKKLFSGGQWIELDVTIKEIPIFYREGSIVPSDMNLNADEKENTSKRYNTMVGLTYWPSLMQSSFNLFWDDGKSKNNLETKKYDLTNFTAQQVDEKTILFKAKDEKTPALQRDWAFILSIPLSKKPTKIFIQGRELKIQEQDSFSNYPEMFGAFWISNNMLIIKPNAAYLKELNIKISL